MLFFVFFNFLLLLQLWFGEKCLQCKKYRYPRLDSEVLDFKEFKRRYHCAKDQWIDGYIDEAYIVRRFGFYRCVKIVIVTIEIV